MNNAFFPMALAVILASAFAVAHLAYFNWDPSRFVLAGEGLADPSEVPEGLYVIRFSSGYDGQAFYRLALDPFTRQQRDFGITLDTPEYRQQRLGYPLLTWIVSAGSPRRVPWALIGINVLALGAIGWVGGALAMALGRHALWGMLFVLHPGFVFSLARDLSEPLSAAFMLAGILLLRRSKATGAAVALTAAVVTRETTVIVPGALMISWLLTLIRGRVARPAREFLIPLTAFAAWQLLLWSWWGDFPATSNENAMALPFAGLVGQVSVWISSFDRDAAHMLAEIVFLILLAVAALAVLRSERVHPHERWAFAGAVAISALLSVDVWYDHAHFLRAVTELYLVGAFIVLAAWPRKPRLLMVMAAMLSLGLAVIFSRNL